MKKIIALSISFLIISCAVAKDDVNFLPANREVRELAIYLNNRLYAEIITIGKSPYSKSYRGIAIHYIIDDSYEWISPRQGWKLQRNNENITDIPQLSKIWLKEPHGDYKIFKGNTRIGGDSYFKLEWRGSIGISEDALFLYYQEAGLMGPKDRKYEIRY